MLIADRTQPRNSTAIKRTAVRGPGVSLDNVGAQLKAPFKPLGTSQIYGTEGFKESPQFASLSNSRWKNFQLRNFRTEIFLQTGKFFQTGKFRRLEKKFQTGNFCRLEKIFRLEIFADWKLLQTVWGDNVQSGGAPLPDVFTAGDRTPYKQKQIKSKILVEEINRNHL